MLDEHVGEVLFAGFEGEGEAGVEVCGEELEGGGFYGGDDEFCGSGRDLPESGGAGFLDFRVGG